MRRHILIFALFLTLAVPALATKNIAISNLTGSVEESARNVLTNRLREELLNTGTFSVMEREQMNLVLQEQGFQQSGACDETACLVQMGQLLGVDNFVSGDVSKLGDLYVISVRMISVKTAKVIAAFSEECRCQTQDLLRLFKPMAQKLAKIADPDYKPDTAGPSATAGPSSREPALASSGKKSSLWLWVGAGAGVAALGAGAAVLMGGSPTEKPPAEPSLTFDDYQGQPPVPPSN